MGLALCLRRVDAAELERLIKSPNQVYRFLLGKDPPLPTDPPLGRPALEVFDHRFGMDVDGFKGILAQARVARFDELPAASPERQRVWQIGEEIDVGKAWHIIHYLLNGTAAKVHGPEGALVGNDRFIGMCEIGDSLPWALLPDEVAHFAVAIAPITRKVMTDRFDVPAMQQSGVYLSGSISIKPDEDNLDYVWHQLARLKKFFAAACRLKQGVILFMV